MRALVVEDDLTSRTLLQNMLKPYGTIDVAVNGREAVEMFGRALREQDTYDLACVDIMMPEMDGHATLKAFRDMEGEYNLDEADAVRVIMTTSLADLENVQQAIEKRCDSYLVKPIQKDRLLQELQNFQLIDPEPNP